MRELYNNGLFAGLHAPVPFEEDPDDAATAVDVDAVVVELDVVELEVVVLEEVELELEANPYVVEGPVVVT